MVKRILFFFFVLLTALVLVTAVLADAPGEGTVLEGVSVPGIALGDKRADVEASVGPHASCSSVEAIGDYASCKFDVDGGGIVWVRYRGPDGGDASNSPDDIVRNIRWSSVPGWVTEAGVNTTLAETDRQAVADAYPHAILTYSSEDPDALITSVKDPELGILVAWHYNPYSNATSIHLAIFPPYTPPPPPDMIHVEAINMMTRRRNITADVLVLDNDDQPVEGVQIDASWTDPKYDTVEVSGTTGSDGLAIFTVNKARNGNYYFYVLDASLDGYLYDEYNSVTYGFARIGHGK